MLFGVSHRCASFIFSNSAEEAVNGDHKGRETIAPEGRPLRVGYSIGVRSSGRSMK
jgi:hypothetical protein